MDKVFLGAQVPQAALTSVLQAVIYNLNALSQRVETVENGGANSSFNTFKRRVLMAIHKAKTKQESALRDVYEHIGMLRYIALQVCFFIS